MPFLEVINVLDLVSLYKAKNKKKCKMDAFLCTDDEDKL